MSLASRTGCAVPARTSAERIETFDIHGSDGTVRHAVLAHPGGDRPVPLLLSPHPFGFTALCNLFGQNWGDRTLSPMPGIWPYAAARGVAVLSLDAHGRREPYVSLGWSDHIDAYASGAARASRIAPIDLTRIYSCGLSMGGMESLLLAAQNPKLIRAVAVQNPVTDLATWLEWLQSQPDLDEHWRTACRELGSDTPGTKGFAQRNPVQSVDRLRRIRLQIRANDTDRIVPAATQARAFRDLLGSDATVEYVVDLPDQTDSGDPGRAAHEHVDWAAMLDFLLDD